MATNEVIVLYILSHRLMTSSHKNLRKKHLEVVQLLIMHDAVIFQYFSLMSYYAASSPVLHVIPLKDIFKYMQSFFSLLR